MLKSEAFWLICSALVVMLLMLLSNNFTSGSDSLGTLLTSQAIWQRRTVKLDAYQSAIKEQPTPYSYQVIDYGSHLYYYYPIGTPLCALPAVAAANMAGLNMANDLHDRWLQRLLSAFTVCLIFILSYLLIRSYLQPRSSFMFLLAMTAGTSIFSSLGTSLWNFNFEIVFILAGLLIVVRTDFSRSTWRPLLLAVALFMAYLCRPTAAIFVALSCFYVLIQSRKAFLKVIVTLSLLFGIFSAFSFMEYNAPLPPYYAPSKIAHSGAFGTALYGILLSPSRGLFIFSPQLLLIFAGTLFFWKRLIRLPLMILMIVWTVAIVVLVARWECWWGGHSYGPRLLTDPLPAVILLGAWTAKEIQSLEVKRRIYIQTAFVILTVLAVFVHTKQGLFNPHTTEWNFRHNLAVSADAVFDWRSPQFLAGL